MDYVGLLDCEGSHWRPDSVEPRPSGALRLDRVAASPILPDFPGLNLPQMNIRIDDITSEGLCFDTPVQQSRLDATLTDANTGCRALASVGVDVRLTKAGERIIVEGDLRTSLEVACRRCLGPIEVGLPVSFRMDLVPMRAGSRPEQDSSGQEIGEEVDSEGSFTLDSADREYYDGDTIDMWPILREQLFLALPDYPLCDQECKGLCQSCGIDLNSNECECDRFSVDPRWDALTKIKLP